LSERDKKAGGGAKRAWPLFMGFPLIIAVAVAAVFLSGEQPQLAAQGQPPQPEEQPSGGG
jgi:hypothetical protein